MHELIALVAQGNAKAIVDDHFALSEVPIAIDGLREGKIAGRGSMYFT